MTHREREKLQAAYQAAKDAGDWKQAGMILINLLDPYPCICATEDLDARQGVCCCDRYASLLRPVTAQELMLSGC